MLHATFVRAIYVVPIHRSAACVRSVGLCGMPLVVTERVCVRVIFSLLQVIALTRNIYIKVKAHVMCRLYVYIAGILLIWDTVDAVAFVGVALLYRHLLFTFFFLLLLFILFCYTCVLCRVCMYICIYTHRRAHIKR